MPPVPTADSGALPAYAKAAGDEPLPGYTLLEPLGRGGFGEVWKCEAPGGLHKAVKFVPGAAPDAANAHQFQQEFAAFQQIKGIRHPFLLTLERVELVDGELVMVMELADHQLRDRFDECRAGGLPGIPRGELLGYFGEIAEALDVISAQFGLQHLDVKPANLFLTAGHAKVGDYGLVSKLDTATGGGGSNRGLTPKYVAPEVLRGQVDTRSDQYSLALVYQELLTGTFPYAARTPQQMMLAHVSSTPDLSGLPECDRSAVAAALAKKPADRFDSCLDFVRTLLAAEYVPPAAPARGPRSVAGGASTVTPFRQRQLEYTPGPGELTGRPTGPGSVTRRPGEQTQNITQRSLPPLTTAGRGPALPPLVAANRWSVPPLPPMPAPRPPVDEDLPLAEPEPTGRVRVENPKSVLPTARLAGHSVPDAMASAGDFVAAVVGAAGAGGHAPQMPGDLGRTADGAWVCRFPTTVSGQIAPLKLAVVRDAWALAMEQPDPERVVFRKAAAGGLWGALSGKKAGLELVVQLPKAGRSVGEVAVTGALFGAPDRAFLQTAQTAIPKIVEDVRRELGNVADRRKSPRAAADFPLTVYQLHSDGTIDPPLAGRCRDVSAGGLGFTTAEPLATKYAYVEFGGVVATAGLAVLVKVLRSNALQPGQGYTYSAQYRVDL